MTQQTGPTEQDITTRRPERATAVVEQELEGNAVLYDPRNDTVHTMNATASAVWWLCDGSRTVEDIAGDIARFFQVSNSTSRADVENLVYDFMEAGVISCK